MSADVWILDDTVNIIENYHKTTRVRYLQYRFAKLEWHNLCYWCQFTLNLIGDDDRIAHRIMELENNTHKQFIKITHIWPGWFKIFVWLSLFFDGVP